MDALLGRINQQVLAPRRSTVAVQATRAIGARKPRGNSGDVLWLPNIQRPSWLDGSLPGDAGFDPVGLSQPTKFLQVDVDNSDLNSGQNKAGQIIGTYTPGQAAVSTNALSPWDEPFSLARFRENELIHGRWAMLACLGVVTGEATTGVSWVDAGKVELDGAQYLGFRLPFTVSQLVWIEALLVGGAEVYRNRSTDLDERLYPGGVFDPLSLAGSASPARTFKLQTAEVKHGRLAMVAFLGFAVQAAVTGQGALGSLATFIENAEAQVAAP